MQALPLRSGPVLALDFNSPLDSVTHPGVYSGDSFRHWSQPESISVSCHQRKRWWGKCYLFTQSYCFCLQGIQLDCKRNLCDQFWPMECGQKWWTDLAPKTPTYSSMFPIPKEEEAWISKWLNGTETLCWPALDWDVNKIQAVVQV